MREWKWEKRKKAGFFFERGGDAPFIQKSNAIYLTCDCAHTLVPITTREMKKKVKKRQICTKKEMKVKIEMSIRGCRVLISRPQHAGMTWGAA